MANRVGQQLGNYRLIHLLGQGGFAEVYLGEHVRLSSQAAIKVLHAHLTGEDMERFQQEATIIASLKHPQIVRTLDFDVQQGVPFLVMDFAPNGTLRQRHPRGIGLPLAQIVPYVQQVAEALQYAHEQRLIHRDVKPENMLLGPNQEVLLSDFGIAVVSQGSSQDSSQAFGGTIAYTAPEQLQDKPRPASDQYSLGVVVYEWLAGERPFEGSFTEIVTKHIFTEPSPLHMRVPAISSALEEVVLRALAKDPKQRFASVQDFALSLEQAAQLKQQGILMAGPSVPDVADAGAPEGLPTRPSGSGKVASTTDLTTQISGDQEALGTHLLDTSPRPSSSKTKTPAAPSAFLAPRFSRRKVLVGLAGVVVVGGAAGISLALAQRGPSHAGSTAFTLPTATNTPPPMPTNIPTPPTLDLHYILLALMDVDYQGLLNGDSNVIDHLQQEVRSYPGLAGKRAGLVETFGGSAGASNAEFGTSVAQAFNRYVLQALGSQGFVFINTVYQEFFDLSAPPSTITSQVYVFK